jgi:hypothetical protein
MWTIVSCMSVWAIVSMSVCAIVSAAHHTTLIRGRTDFLEYRIGVCQMRKPLKPAPDKRQKCMHARN